MCLAGNLFAQINTSKRMFVPFLDKESQSNVVVTFSDIFNGKPCPAQYTNVLSNTNLFLPEEQALLRDIFLRYKTVTTRSGPPGTSLIRSYQTNFINGKKSNSNWVSNFQNTNLGTKEDLFFDAQTICAARLKTKTGEGYTVVFYQEDGGLMFRLMQDRHGVRNGLLVQFYGEHWYLINT